MIETLDFIENVTIVTIRAIRSGDDNDNGDDFAIDYYHLHSS